MFRSNMLRISNFVAKIIFTIILISPIVMASQRFPKIYETYTNKQIPNNNFNVISFNTEYWHTSEKELIELLDLEKADLVFLQEHLKIIEDKYYPINDTSKLTELLEGRHIESHGEVVTISKWTVENRQVFGEGTAIRTDHKIESGQIISAYNIHLPVHLHLNLITKPVSFYLDAQNTITKREELLRDVILDISQNKNAVIVGGDFNTAIAMNSLSWFRENLIDSYSAPHCNTRGYGTWSLNNLLNWRIDYVFTSKDITPQKYCTQEIQDISDHKAVITELAL